MPTAPAPEHAAVPDRKGRVGVWRRVAWWGLVTCFSLVLFLGALLASAPASSVTRLASLPPPVVGLQGRLWRGRALLAGGLTLGWRLAPERLLLGQLTAEIEIIGPRTSATAEARAGLLRVGLYDLAGRVGPEILALVQANGLTCTMMARLEAVSLTRARSGATTATGSVHLPPGQCSNAIASEVPIPALTVRLSDDGQTATARVTAEDTPDISLGEARLSPESVVVRVEPAGARLIPGLPDSAPTQIELPL